MCDTGSDRHSVAERLRAAARTQGGRKWHSLSRRWWSSASTRFGLCWRTAKTLIKLNQTDGFDCMSCAWPDPEPDHRHTAEFCENGAKAVAEEANKERVGRDFFERYSVEELSGYTDY